MVASDAFWSGVVATLLAELVLLIVVFIMEVVRRRRERRRAVVVAFTKAASELRFAYLDGLFADAWVNEAASAEWRDFSRRFRDSLLEIIALSTHSDRSAAIWMLLELQLAAQEPFEMYEHLETPRELDHARAAWAPSLGPGPAGGELVNLPDPGDAADWVGRVLPGPGLRMTYYEDRLIPERRKYVLDSMHYPEGLIGFDILGWPSSVKQRRSSRVFEDRFELIGL